VRPEVFGPEPLRTELCVSAFSVFIRHVSSFQIYNSLRTNKKRFNYSDTCFQAASVALAATWIAQLRFDNHGRFQNLVRVCYSDSRRPRTACLRDGNMLQSRNRNAASPKCRTSDFCMVAGFQSSDFKINLGIQLLSSQNEFASR
jgi:hypothetical protein